MAKSKLTDVEATSVALGVLAPPLLAIVTTLMYVVFFPFLLLKAWVIQTLYIWFIVPFGAPVIGYWHTVGILLLFNLLTSRFTHDDDKNEKIWMLGVKQLVYAAGYLLVLLTGLIAHGLM